jgi:hypothetical protein
MDDLFAVFLKNIKSSLKPEDTFKTTSGLPFDNALSIHTIYSPYQSREPVPFRNFT